MKNIKIGVLGCSSIARRSIIPAILKTPNLELCLIGTNSFNSTKEFAKQYDIGVCSYEELLDANLDAIYVSVPVGLHYEYGKKVLEKGKHLLLEKTFTHSLQTTEELLNLAYQNNLVAMEALMYQYHPLLEQIKNLIDKNKIGNILQMELNFGFPDLPPEDIRYKAELGGGAILDALTYPLSCALFLNKGKYKSFNYAINFDFEKNVDSRGNIILEFEKSKAFITFGFGYSYRNDYRIWGDKGLIEIKRAFSRPPDFKNDILIEHDGQIEKHTVHASDHFVNMLTNFASKIMTHNFEIDLKLLERMQIISEIYNHRKKKEVF